MTDVAKAYWRVVDREHHELARTVVTQHGEFVAQFADARGALAAVGGHNRDLRDGRVVLEDGSDAGT